MVTMSYDTMFKSTFNQQTDFPGIPFQKFSSGYFAIDYMMIKYFLPYEQAKKLDEFWRVQSMALPNIKEWYCELREEDKAQIVRYDLNENKYL